MMASAYIKHAMKCECFDLTRISKGRRHFYFYAALILLTLLGNAIWKRSGPAPEDNEIARKFAPVFEFTSTAKNSD
jgi:hypothetical protein